MELRTGAASCSYSPECVEGGFWEVSIRDPAWIDARRPFGRRYPPPTSKNQTPNVVVSHKDAETCMRSGEVSYQSEPDPERISAGPVPAMGRGGCDEVCSRHSRESGNPLRGKRFARAQPEAVCPIT